jgi:hypothetical protein
MFYTQEEMKETAKKTHRREKRSLKRKEQIRGED